MGWYEDWRRQNLAFTPRMDQGGGEYTGYIPDVYEGDDAQRAWLQPNLLSLVRKPTPGTREISGAPAVTRPNDATTNLSGVPNPNPGLMTNEFASSPMVTEAPPMQQMATPPAVTTSAVAPTGTGAPWTGMAGLAKKTGNLIPEPYWNAGFGLYDKIMGDVKRDFDQGGGALDPTSHNNYVQQLIRAGANSETIARLMDKFMPMGESAAGVIAGLGQNALSLPVTETATKYGKNLLGYGNKLANYLGEQGRFTKNFWGNVYDEQLGNVKDKYQSLFPTTEAEPTRDFTTSMNPENTLSSNPLLNPALNSQWGDGTENWAGGFMDEQIDQSGRGFGDTSPLAKTLRNAFGSGDTSSIVDNWRESRPEFASPTAGDKIRSLGQGMHDTAAGAVDTAVDMAPPAVLGAGGAFLAKKAYDNTEMGQLKIQLKNAPNDMARKNIQTRISEKRARNMAAFKAKYLPKGMKGVTKPKLLAVLSGLAFGLGAIDLVRAEGGDEEAATDRAIQYALDNPQVMQGLSTVLELTDPVSMLLGGTSGRTTNQMGPLVGGQYQWNTPSIDPSWRY